MKKVKDVFQKGKKRLSLPDHWVQAIADAKKVGNPLADLDHSRAERSRAAFVVIAWGGKDEMKLVKKHPKVKAYLDELKDYR